MTVNGLLVSPSCSTQEQALTCVRTKVERCSEGKKFEVYQYLQTVQRKLNLNCEEDFDSCIYEFKSYSEKILTSVVKIETNVLPKAVSQEASSKAASTKTASSKAASGSTDSGTKAASKENTKDASDADSNEASNEDSNDNSQQAAQTASQQTTQDATNDATGSAEGTVQTSGSVDTSAENPTVTVTAAVMTEYCSRAEAAWRCIESRVQDSGLSTGMISVLRTTLTEVLYMIRAKCDGRCFYRGNLNLQEFGPL